MAQRRTAVVAGAGIAGLSVAASLARAGFAVQILERSAEPREFGAGIYLKENSLPVLDELGAGDRVARHGVRIRAVRIVDERQATIVTRDTGAERVIVALRAELHGALLDAALAAGVSLRTRATVTGAHPDGRLALADGTEVGADVVIGADGFSSAVRDSLGLARRTRTLGDGATRVLVPRREQPYSTEYWAGHVRVGIAPCSEDLSYVFLIGPERDPRAVRVPVDRDYWSRALPHIADVFERISDDSGIHHPHPYVSCHRWTAGRVAIVGDAAHAQPPNLGQGAGLAIAAGWELARRLTPGGDTAEQLQAWERSVRPAMDTVQRITTAYDVAGYGWPLAAQRARAELFHRLSTFRPAARKWEYYWRGGCPAPASPVPWPAAGAEPSAAT